MGYNMLLCEHTETEYEYTSKCSLMTWYKNSLHRLKTTKRWWQKPGG